MKITTTFCKNVLAVCFLCMAATGFAQETIGTNNPNPNAALDITANDKGLLNPRVALTGTANAAPLGAHVAGMSVYNTATAGNVTPGYYVNDGTKWVRMANAASVDATNDAWVNNPTDTRVELATLSDGTTARPAGTEFVALDNGKVGIGTTSIGAPYLFQVEGSTRITGRFDVKTLTDGTVAQFRQAGGGTNNVGLNIDVNDAAGSVTLLGSGTHNPSALHFAMNSTPRLTVLRFGNVGIGTTVPAGRLDVVGPSQTTAGIISRGSTLDNNWGGHIDFLSNNGTSVNAGIKTSINGMFFYFGGSERVRISNSGNVGIGTTTPAATLDVSGTGSMKVPVGTTAERPAAPAFGMVRYNSTIGRGEMYVNDVNGDGTQGDAGWRPM